VQAVKYSNLTLKSAESLSILILWQALPERNIVVTPLQQSYNWLVFSLWETAFECLKVITGDCTVSVLKKIGVIDSWTLNCRKWRRNHKNIDAWFKKTQYIGLFMEYSMPLPYHQGQSHPNSQIEPTLKWSYTPRSICRVSSGTKWLMHSISPTNK
jgi:hypothetical protein